MDHRGWIIGLASLTVLLAGCERGPSGTWERQVSSIETNLSSLSFVDERTGWVVGEGGTILHTEDGGRTWIRQDSGTETNLFCVDFIDPRKGWVAGDEMTLIETTDGGRRWRKLKINREISDSPAAILDVDRVNDKKGYAVGSFKEILATFTAAEQWDGQITGGRSFNTGIFFLSPTAHPLS